MRPERLLEPAELRVRAEPRVPVGAREELGRRRDLQFERPQREGPPQNLAVGAERPHAPRRRRRPELAPEVLDEICEALGRGLRQRGPDAIQQRFGEVEAPRDDRGQGRGQRVGERVREAAALEARQVQAAREDAVARHDGLEGRVVHAAVGLIKSRAVHGRRLDLRALGPERPRDGREGVEGQYQIPREPGIR